MRGISSQPLRTILARSHTAFLSPCGANGAGVPVLSRICPEKDSPNVPSYVTSHGAKPLSVLYSHAMSLGARVPPSAGAFRGTGQPSETSNDSAKPSESACGSKRVTSMYIQRPSPPSLLPNGRKSVSCSRLSSVIFIGAPSPSTKMSPITNGERVNSSSSTYRVPSESSA